MDENGEIPKENDHTIDAFRYLLSNAYYNEVPREQITEVTDRRGFTIDEDMQRFRQKSDPFEKYKKAYYH